MFISIPLIKYVLYAAFRDRLILAMILFMAVSTSVALFIGSSATNESDQFAIVFASSGLRLAGAIGLILFTIFYIRRAFETKDVEYLLSRPISQTQFIISHAIAFSILAFLVATIAQISLIVIGGGNVIVSGQALWYLSLIVEYVIMINAAMFFSMVLTSAATVSMAVIGLYVLSRMMGQFLGILDNTNDVAYEYITGKVMQFISLAFPRLDLMGQTSWLVYGVTNPNIWTMILLQGVVYTFLLIVASIFDLRRRQF
jgi:ABC-type transport system involved in multi-copper enzyme maturation permease subunit